MKFTELELEFLTCLNVGAENAVKVTDLATLLNKPHRIIYELKESIIKKGIIIGSSKSSTNGGLYIVSSQSEKTSTLAVKRATIRAEESQVSLIEQTDIDSSLSLFATLKGDTNIKRTGQLDLFEEE